MALLRVASGSRASGLLSHWLRLGKNETSVENLGARTIETNPVVPTRLDREAIGALPIAAAKLDSHRSVWILPGCNVVQRVGIAIVLVEVSVGAVHADRPEAIDRNVAFDGEPVDCLSIVLCRNTSDIQRVFGSVAAPAGRTTYQMPDRIDPILWAEHPPGVRNRSGKDEK